MNVLVVCASGMSSSALVQKLRKEIAERGLTDIKVGSCANMELNVYAVQADLIIFAPQLSFMAESFKNPYHSRIIVLEREEYGMQDAGRIIDKIQAPEKMEGSSAEENRYLLRTKTILGRITANHMFIALIDGLAGVMPVSVIGAVFVILESLPFPGYVEWLNTTGIAGLLNLGWSMTLGCISLYLCIMISLSYASQKNVNRKGVALAVLASFLILVRGDTKDVITMTYFGSRGLFTAMIVSLFVCSIYIFLTKRQKGGDLAGLPKEIRNSFLSLVPFMICVLLALSMIILIHLLGHKSLPAMIDEVIGGALIRVFGTSLWSMAGMNLLALLLWFFGIHGGHITGIITDPVYLSLSMENIDALRAGNALPNMINSAFGNTFTFGGIGSTLSLAFLCMFMARSRKLKSIGRISFPMGIFFVNEPLLFGIPIILNPKILVPFIGVPGISGVLTVIAMKTGLIPYAVGYPMPWTTPPVISGFVQGGWKLALWQVFILILQGFLWYPFFRILDKEELELEKESSG